MFVPDGGLIEKGADDGAINHMRHEENEARGKPHSDGEKAGRRVLLDDEWMKGRKDAESDTRDRPMEETEIHTDSRAGAARGFEDKRVCVCDQAADKKMKDKACPPGA